MQWAIPRQGQHRIVHTFLIIPLCIDHKCKWMEKASYIEEYQLTGTIEPSYQWVPSKWINDI